MCGITGAFAIDGRQGPPLPRHVLERMTEVIEHRGPDDAGHVLGDSYALGARRLSIIDVAGGHQPLSDERQVVWGAQNGELYEHDRIRADLEARGHSFRTRCDTEILPHLYEEYGPHLCEHLLGKYAIAVWDTEARRGVIARDRLGIKPLYYAVVDGVVIFGSELRCIAASGLVSDELDLEALAAYLVLGYIPGPLTGLRDVRKVMPGERLIIGDGKVVAERYWTHPKPAPVSGVSETEWVQRLNAGLSKAVERRLMADVPLGAMLSGGLDSSLIVALMARATNAPVKTFSIGFSGDDGNELDEARRVSQALGTEHYELELPMATGEGVVERLAGQLDEPIRSLSALGFEALSELARTEVTVALAGQGADELFGGYRKHRAAALAGAWNKLPGAVRAPIAAGLRRGPEAAGRLGRALEAPDHTARLLMSSGLLEPDAAAGVFSGSLSTHRDAARRVIDGYATGLGSASPLGGLLHLDAQLGLVDDMLAYFDRTSMAHSLEVRVPFLDHELVELAAQMPDSVKVRGRETKRVLREAARGLVPDFVLDRPKRGFFKDSVGAWLAADGGSVVDRLLLGAEPRYAELVEPAVIAHLVAEWRAGAHQHAQFLLAMVILEAWLSSALPAAFAVGRGDHVAV
jgi:asparagine synthase (glutamine-hydrolysing)